ncbi:LacI family DNA-binding transcriptional regulator [Pseudovibrio sp. Ad26]|uniref:LacI family DNA-binding transcriptional regulator n=1 Tax=Pseudovibrio sp. Ad26 TaxID=989410 RepID=UPI0007AEA012|nr:LacI family DNA-binding transcriptional regulator [Pseudovibrio sp. Ad26]KZL15287.1 HTH-type transcriptional repressor CytR [Pseudovibrio sp. Ad26]
MTSKVVTVQDVAIVAGVSTATVSRALSKPAKVNTATREKVMAAVRVTGYRINQTARNLRKKEAGAVVALVPNLGNPFFSSILSGIESVLAKEGLSLLVVDILQTSFKREQAYDYLSMNQADGLLVLDGTLDLTNLNDGSVSSELPPVVYCCEWGTDPRFGSVRVDNHQGSQLAVSHLHTLGHNAIGLVRGPSENRLTAARQEGFEAAISEYSLPLREEWLIDGDFSLDAGVQAAHRWCALDERPTAMFCMSDEIAFGFISELDRLGFSVPTDVSVIGFDDIAIAERFIPSLTTIRQPRFRIGQEAAGKLLRRIAGEVENRAESEAAARRAVLPVELIERRSTAPVSEKQRAL